METNDHKRVREIIDRLGRVLAAEEWNDEINPTQWMALSYLARANKFSRSPSQVAAYMAATRGTVSQTLKALSRKGLIIESRSEQDKRSISYSVTKQGSAMLLGDSLIEDAVSAISAADRAALLTGLERLVRKALQQRGSRPFGVCATCVHHHNEVGSRYCNLLNEPLSSSESEQICYEHAAES